MRISVVDGDHGFVKVSPGAGYEARLNGKRVKRCITADTDRGYVVKYCYRNGRPVVDGDSVRTARVFGEVHIFRNGEQLA